MNPVVWQLSKKITGEASCRGMTDLLLHFHPQRKGAYTVWGRQHEERKRNLGYRVDYILLGESRREGSNSDVGVSEV